MSEMTYCDAERAVKDGSYKASPDDDLHEMHMACLGASGPNTLAVERIRKIGDIIWRELRDREQRRQNQQTSGIQDCIETSDVSASGDTSSTWDEAELLKLVNNGIEENLNLEYKAAGAVGRDGKKPIEITKDVSSMANSAGGVLIYGLKEFQQVSKEHLAESIDPIKRTEYPKEWLEQIVAQIRPRIVDLRIHPIQLSSGLDDTAYVVEVPKSTTAHQASDFRYYRRYNFQSVPMHDHEVRDVMNRAVQPQVKLSAEFVVYARPNRDGHEGALVVSISNTSDVLARYVGMLVYSPIRVQGRLISYDQAILEGDSAGACYQLSFSNHNGAPLFPRGTLRALFPFTFPVQITPEPLKQLKDFRLVVFADSMPKQTLVLPAAQIYRPSARDGQNIG